MIRVVGLKKVFLLFLLAMFLVVSFLYTSYSMKPTLSKTTVNLRNVKSDISEMQADMDALVEGLQKFERQKEQFEFVKNSGFFDPQNRVEIRNRFNVMQQESRLLSARYTISPAVTEDNQKAADAGYKVLNTKITFILEALEDVDIYKFLHLLNHGFPGHVSIENVTLSREKEITQPLLRKIGSGDFETLIQASVTATWRTMIPDPSISLSNDNENGGN